MGTQVKFNELIRRIDGLRITPLKRIADERGVVMHFLRSDSPNFKSFGEAYFSIIYQNVIKGWKRHRVLYQNFCVPNGSIQFVIFDDRDGSITKGNFVELILDNNENYILLSMPPGLWYSFKCLSKSASILANIINEPHSQEESETKTLTSKDIPYEWK